MREASLYSAPGLDPLVMIQDDGALLATLNEVMLGWRMAPVAAAAWTAPTVHVVQGPRGWTCYGETYEKPLCFHDPVATACSVIASLYKSHTLIDRSGLCLHAAGLRIGPGLMLLTGHYRSGKTVLSAAAAAAGLHVFSDDIVPLSADGQTAFAPGLAIRLRLPMPECLSQRTRDFVEAHRIASSPRYAYIRPPEGRLARKGAAAPVTAIVSLCRRTEGPAELSRIGEGDALGETIRRNFARQISAARILDALDGLIGRAVCLRLEYADAEEAVEVLRQAAETGYAGLDPADPAQTAVDGKRRAANLAPETIVARTRGIESRERDGQAFLTDAAEKVIFTLNETGTAAWRLTETPISFGEIVTVFLAGFPGRAPSAMEQDLAHLFCRLAARGLVRLS